MFMSLDETTVVDTATIIDENTKKSLKKFVRI